MKKSPEPVILTVALVVLALGAALLAYFFPSVRDITGISSTDPTGKHAAPLKADDIAATLAVWASPTLWQEPPSHNRLFSSDKYLFYPSTYPNGDYIKKLDPTQRSPSGVLLSWYEKYGLDFTDPNVDREDPDNDGFSNITEFKNEPIALQGPPTSTAPSRAIPSTPRAIPSTSAAYRLQKVRTAGLPHPVQGLPAAQRRVPLPAHLKDVPELQPAAAQEDQRRPRLPGLQAQVLPPGISGHQGPRNGRGRPPPMSPSWSSTGPTSTLDVPLIFRQEINSPESTADFVMLMPSEVDKVIKVSPRQNFLPRHFSSRHVPSRHGCR
ncbi:MAG: hypothetical protein WDO13_07715 [Verrucomicrobiota bacterium]